MTAAAPPGEKPGDRVPLGEKISYGVGAMTEQVVGNATKHMFHPIFNIGLGLNPVLVGIILMIYQIWDGIIDPVIGNVSDNCRSRWGRRKPFIVLGGLLTGLAFPFLWQASAHWSPALITGYVVVTGILMYTFFSFWGMPYYSLGMELTPSFNERTRVVAFRAVFGKLTGLFTGWILALATCLFSAGQKEIPLRECVP